MYEVLYSKVTFLLFYIYCQDTFSCSKIYILIKVLKYTFILSIKICILQNFINFIDLKNQKFIL